MVMVENVHHILRRTVGLVTNELKKHEHIASEKPFFFVLGNIKHTSSLISEATLTAARFFPVTGAGIIARARAVSEQLIDIIVASAPALTSLGMCGSTTKNVARKSRANGRCWEWSWAKPRVHWHATIPHPEKNANILRDAARHRGLPASWAVKVPKALLTSAGKSWENVDTRHWKVMGANLKVPQDSRNCEP